MMKKPKMGSINMLQAGLENTPSQDLKIVLGDMNAKVGSDNTNCNRAMGKEGCGIRNENGERLKEHCTTYDLVIIGTLFPHIDIHKLTWYSPNGKDRNQIDNLMINGTWRRSLLDIKAKERSGCQERSPSCGGSVEGEAEGN